MEAIYSMQIATKEISSVFRFCTFESIPFLKIKKVIKMLIQYSELFYSSYVVIDGITLLRIRVTNFIAQMTRPFDSFNAYTHLHIQKIKTIRKTHNNWNCLSFAVPSFISIHITSFNTIFVVDCSLCAC